MGGGGILSVGRGRREGVMRYMYGWLIRGGGECGVLAGLLRDLGSGLWGRLGGVCEARK